MITSKKITVIIFAALAFSVLLAEGIIIYANFIADKEALKSDPSYVEKIFGEEIITVDIRVDEEVWQGMLNNAAAEEFIMADVLINGTELKNVGIRPKGNSSLSNVEQSDSDRYSLRINFDEYISGQTCFGLDRLVLNNMLGDTSYMEEYISYDIMNFIGVDAPCFGYAEVRLNGEPIGFYLALELYGDSYEGRVHGTTEGMLYNVKMTGGMDNANNNFIRAENIEEGMEGEAFGGQMRPPGGRSEGFPEDQMLPLPGENAFKEPPDGGGLLQSGLPGEGERRQEIRIGGAGIGGSLQYIDDDPESYSSIFQNVVKKGEKSDYERVIAAIKSLNEGESLEEYFDIDKILRYLAAHTVVVNLDSYSSNMAQNYYIYERGGKITILPWDYNYSWGGFASGDISSVINFPIDTPVSGVSMEERPLISKLLENEEYFERYHGYLREIAENYFGDGKFDAKIDALNALISVYVENDPTAFSTFEEYNKAAAAFKKLGNLRAKSIIGQLNGSVPSTAEGQNENKEALIQAGDLTLSDLGSAGGGMMRVQRRGEENGQTVIQYGDFSFDTFQNLDPEVIKRIFEILADAGSNITDEVRESLKNEGLTDEQIDTVTSMMGGGRISREGPPEMANKAGQGMKEEQTFFEKYGLSLILLIVLLIATLFVAKFRRKY